MDSAIHIMKRKLFPFHYDPSPWVQGENLENNNNSNNISQQQLHAVILFKQLTFPSQCNSGITNVTFISGDCVIYI